TWPARRTTASRRTPEEAMRRQRSPMCARCDARSCRHRNSARQPLEPLPAAARRRGADLFLVSGWLTAYAVWLAGFGKFCFGSLPYFWQSSREIPSRRACILDANAYHLQAIAIRNSPAEVRRRERRRPTLGGCAMVSTLMITFREGVEALLIVAIALMYLRRTGRGFLAPAIHAGWGVAIAGSVLLGVILAKVGSMTPLAEGLLALLAA